MIYYTTEQLQANGFKYAGISLTNCKVPGMWQDRKIGKYLNRLNYRIFRTGQDIWSVFINASEAPIPYKEFAILP